MKKNYRMSAQLPISVSFIGAIVGLAMGFYQDHPLNIFLGLWLGFSIVALILWSVSEIRFSENYIIRRLFFLYDKKYPIVDIKEVALNKDKDAFGGGSKYLTIKFENKKSFILLGFKKSDIREITERIKEKKPQSINRSVSEYIS